MADYHSTKIGNQLNLSGLPGKLALHDAAFGARIAKSVATVMLLGFIAGCAVSGPKIAQLDNDALLVTGSVTKPAKVAGVDSADAEVIKSVVAEASFKTKSSIALAWRNPDTGSSGTITAIDKFLGNHGQNCRGFKTTVSTFMGIAFYNGEACQISPTEWVLSWFRPLDANG